MSADHSSRRDRRLCDLRQTFCKVRMQRVQMWTERSAPLSMSFVFWTLGWNTLFFLGARRAHPILCVWRIKRPYIFDLPQKSH